jgi:hypothetical protein
MFAIRNAISEAQDEIVSYNWVDPETGRKVGGGTMYLVLSKMAKHCWAPAAVSCLGYKTIARSADCNKGWVPVALRAAVNGGIIGNLDGVSKYNTNKYAMSVGFIEEFVERASLPVPEILKEFRRLNPDPEKLAAEDAAEEEQMMEAEDAGIPVFDTEGKPVPTAEEIMDEAGLYLTSFEGREFGRQTST